jgi:uncharacterized protein (DUF2062 family)
MAESMTGAMGRRTSLLFQRRIISPVLHLLRVGASPRKLAWSLALGIAVGVNPLLGSTTVVCLILAFVLRLNLVASQITNHLVYPLQLAMFFVFLGAGDRVFHTGALPLGREALLHAMRHHPLATTRLLWGWEWHALIVWGVFALLVTPLLVAILTPMLHRLLLTMQHDSPVHP